MFPIADFSFFFEGGVGEGSAAKAAEAAVELLPSKPQPQQTGNHLIAMDYITELLKSGKL